MILIMRRDATGEETARVIGQIELMGLEPALSTADGRTVILAVGENIAEVAWEAFPGVERAVRLQHSHGLADRQLRADDTVVKVGGARFGAGHFGVIAGPCAVESREQLLAAAAAVQRAGAHVLRGDSFKPRSSPYSFQGLGKPGLELMAEAREAVGLPFVAEVVDPRDVELVASWADMVRVGARSMTNYTLLSEVGRQAKPVLLKRGLTATIDDWLSAAEYVLKEGNDQVVLCERGIRTFETSARSTLDLTAVPIVKGLSHLPVVIDPSHASGLRRLVPPLSRAAVVSGADGFMVDVHPAPEAALVDGAQALRPDEFEELMAQVRRLADVMELEL